MFSIEREEQGGICRIAVSGEMTIYSAAELKDKLVAAAGGSPVDLDLSAVSEFDSAGVQLLALLQRTACDAATVRVAGASDCVRELLDLYRLLGQLCSGDAASASANDGSAS